MTEAIESDNLASAVYPARNENQREAALLRKIESLEKRHLKCDEVISILFLLHRNAKETYRDLEEFLNGRKSNLIHKWCIQGVNSDEMWERKFYESLFIIKNFKMLKEFDIEKVNAVHTFNHKYFIPGIRLELYKICENIYGSELKNLLAHMRESEVNVKYVDYLEMYLLKWIGEGIISLDNKINVKILADSLQAIGGNNFANELFHYPVKRLIKADEYPIIDPTNVGLCLIINQKKFTPDPASQKVLPDRNGTEHDGSRLEELFSRKLKFDVKVKNDVPSGTMIKIIPETVKNFFKPNHSVFFLIILSHGSKDHVYGSDSRPVSIYYHIDYCLKIPELEGKPKVIVIQACQGDWYPKARPESKIEKDGGVTLKDWPTDTLFCMSTIPLFASCRHKELGAWYIIKLCEVIEQHPEEDFVTILTEVNRILNSEPVFNSQEEMRAIPEHKSRLTRKLYLKPKQN